ncbi:hypothetical protein M2139_000999 [Enterococcus sp. PF1-24]|uniref:hypothetical protein n=1 Tax=unclassified Enterococcus TaxID=2608891 RepID=UPI0024733DEE|nr:MULTISPECIES: hypothetical protein [unclassified Enterococcus]MDH6364014.1 hypothetical protein [Enterococcus sp. PFB1-1]MDH6401115.1 hypothetical protein [Enterococcus sp. PF1-24]
MNSKKKRKRLKQQQIEADTFEYKRKRKRRRFSLAEFLEEHDGLSIALNLLVVPIFGLITAIIVQLDDSAWKVPLFTNILLLFLTLWGQFTNKTKKNSRSLAEFISQFKWLNVVLLVCHGTIGFHKKYSQKVTVKPLWFVDSSDAKKALLIYLIILSVLFTLSFFIKDEKKQKKKK